MNDRDPDAALDAEFHRAHITVRQHEGNADITNEVIKASARMIEIANEKGDPLMWAFVFAAMDDFIKNGAYPPFPLIAGINEAFTKFRGPIKSLDEAFGMNKLTKGRPVRMLQREIARTRASVVSNFIQKGDTLEVAVEKAASGGIRKALGGVSEAQMKRDYLKYRRII